MRWQSMWLAAALTLAAVSPALAQGRSGCPASPVFASFSIWPKGTLERYKIVEGQHACGRYLQCQGSYAPNGPRRCSWR